MTKQERKEAINALNDARDMCTMLFNMAWDHLYNDIPIDNENAMKIRDATLEMHQSIGCLKGIMKEEYK